MRINVSKGYNVKPELYYNKMGLPKCVRIVSDKLQLDHTFCPAAGPIDCLSPQDYMRLLHQGIFSNVIILPEKNDAYIKAPPPENKIFLNDWISLSDFNNVLLV